MWLVNFSVATDIIILYIDVGTVGDQGGGMGTFLYFHRMAGMHLSVIYICSTTI